MRAPSRTGIPEDTKEDQMRIVSASEAPETDNPHGVSARPLHSSEHVQVSMITLQPGQALKLHSTPVDAFFYVLEGSGTVEPAMRAKVCLRICSSRAQPRSPTGC
jgi:mannose-6-phosphate isomerase-like protein (cupin superfamily)